MIGDGKLWFDYAFDFFDGFALVGLNGKYSFIDSNGQLIGNGKLWFDEANDFSPGGFARVKLDGQKMLINTKGEIVKFYD